MSKFDYRVKIILNEFLGSRAATDFSRAFAAAASGNAEVTRANLAGKSGVNSNTTKKDTKSYSQSNRPKRGDVAVDKTGKYKTKVVSDMDQNGNYGVAPHSDGSGTPNYYFVKTTDDLKTWRPVDKNLIDFKKYTANGKPIANKDLNGRPTPYQICPSKEIPYITVGNTGTDLDTWYNEKTFNELKQQQKQAQQQPQKQQDQQPQQSTDRVPRSPRKDAEVQNIPDQIGVQPQPAPAPKEKRRPPRNGDVYSTTPKSKDEPINTWRYDGKNWVNQANSHPASNQRVTQLITTWWSIKNFGYQ